MENSKTAGSASSRGGIGRRGYGGDGGQAEQASFQNISGIASDDKGNVYIVDWENARIRKVDTSGIVSTFAGTGEFGYSGDDGPATEAKIAPIYGGVTVDREGNVYFADNENHRIRKVTPDGVISTIAGKEDSEVGDGDGGPATEARFEMVADVRLDGEGNIYLKDERAGTIQKIDKEGTIRTIAGGGVCRPLERECQATEARLSFNWGWIFDGPKLSSMAVTPEGHVYFTDGGGLIWMLKPL